jgi:hypothetical protein
MWLPSSEPDISSVERQADWGQYINGITNHTFMQSWKGEQNNTQIRKSFYRKLLKKYIHLSTFKIQKKHVRVMDYMNNYPKLYLGVNYAY